jgi:AcrR family transcriptional regulator
VSLVSRGEETRSTVLDAALELASSEGLAGVTIGRLAEQVGMSKSGLFAHFHSKEGLQIEILRAAIERFTSFVIAPALKARRGEPRVEKLFERWLAWGEELPGGCVFVVASIELDDKPGPVRDVLTGSQRDWLEMLATAGRIAVQEGHFRPDLDVDQLAHEIYTLGVGHHVALRLLQSPQAEARTATAFSKILQGARAPT